MATQSHRLIQDQNLNVLCNGVTLGGKINNAAKAADKKGLGGGRKALNDISNSRRPSTIYSTKKQNSTNVISIEKDPHEARSKVSKVPEKGAIGVRSRKALTDLTNSAKPSSQQASSRAAVKFNTCTGENVPSSIMEEGFLHNHQECIKAQKKAVDMDNFLETVGLKHDMPVGELSAFKFSSPNKVENSMRYLEEISDQIFEVQVPQCKNSKLSNHCCSPKSPKPSFWEDDVLFDLMVETPKRLLYP